VAHRRRGPVAHRRRTAKGLGSQLFGCAATSPAALVTGRLAGTGVDDRMCRSWTSVRTGMWLSARPKVLRLSLASRPVAPGSAPQRSCRRLTAHPRRPLATASGCPRRDLDQKASRSPIPTSQKVANDAEQDKRTFGKAAEGCREHDQDCRNPFPRDPIADYALMRLQVQIWPGH
jgi:hypothetical protein